ncbi:MAG: endonuclease/exonuclease/phosphatase family protein [Oceanospirillaceae bacterium]|nr:endonuclease/exonuclease/phosphatase family protein [Oceanospirillaceae bacterium]
MPFYNDLRPQSDYSKRDFALIFPDMTDAAKIRTIDGLLRLKTGLQSIPPRRTEQNLLIASWNIKEFGHTTQRLPEAYFYIAEILACFDLVAIQEVKSTLKDLDIVMRILGGNWDYLVNDITDGTDGNSERSAYLFNNKRVQLSGTVGEIVLWPDITAGSDIKQLKRTPYVTGFRSGWKEFALINLHLHPGDDDDDVSFRKEEITLLLRALEVKANEHWTRNMVLCGDFNLYHGEDDPTVTAISNAGFKEIDGLVGKNTTATQTQAYDRMFLRTGSYFKLVKDAGGKDIGGVFNPFDFIFRQQDHRQYKDDMLAVYGGSKDLVNDSEALEDYFMHYWRRNQISDHLPIWFELETDSSAPFLESRRQLLASG